MFSSSYRFSKHFKAIPSSLLLFTALIVFLFPAGIARGFELSFVWSANTEPELAGYRVFYRQEGHNYDYNNPAWDGTETICTINGLDDNFTYYFVSRAYDIYGNESENSVELCHEPSSSNLVPTTSSSSGGGCFIATASYGSPLEPHVKLLRQFRDRFLFTNVMGKIFVRLYYQYSPPIADLISGHESLRMVVRWILLPLVGMSWSFLKFGFLPTTLFLLLLLTMITDSLMSLARVRERQLNKSNQSHQFQPIKQMKPIPSRNIELR